MSFSISLCLYHSIMSLYHYFISCIILLVFIILFLSFHLLCAYYHSLMSLHSFQMFIFQYIMSLSLSMPLHHSFMAFIISYVIYQSLNSFLESFIIPFGSLNLSLSNDFSSCCWNYLYIPVVLFPSPLNCFLSTVSFTSPLATVWHYLWIDVFLSNVHLFTLG